MDAARAAWKIMQLFDVLCKTKRTPNYPGILGSDEKATHNGKLFDISLPKRQIAIDTAAKAITFVAFAT